eukprot:270586-Chlamydomonas_euryale.AAC.2
MVHTEARLTINGIPEPLFSQDHLLFAKTASCLLICWKAVGNQAAQLASTRTPRGAARAPLHQWDTSTTCT